MYNICFLSGDGVGPLLCRYAADILHALGERFGFSIQCCAMPFGKGAYQSYGDPLPAQTVQQIRQADAALILGVDTIGMPGATPVGKLRKTLNLYAEVRAMQADETYWCLKPDIRMAFVREITQGFLADRNMYLGVGEIMPDSGTALSIRVITRPVSERIAAFAFDYAQRMGYGRVTAVHKASILKMTCGMFLEACRKEAAKYPQIQYDEANVDDAAGELIRSPEKFGVIVATNMFGDILSDEAAALVSGRCIGVNIGEEACVYLPVIHGPFYEAALSDTYDCSLTMMALSQLLGQLKQSEARAFLEKAAQ